MYLYYPLKFGIYAYFVPLILLPCKITLSHFNSLNPRPFCLFAFIFWTAAGPQGLLRALLSHHSWWGLGDHTGGWELLEDQLHARQAPSPLHQALLPRCFAWVGLACCDLHYPPYGNDLLSSRPHTALGSKDSVGLRFSGERTGPWRASRASSRGPVPERYDLEICPP